MVQSLKSWKSWKKIIPWPLGCFLFNRLWKKSRRQFNSKGLGHSELQLFHNVGPPLPWLKVRESIWLSNVNLRSPSFLEEYLYKWLGQNVFPVTELLLWFYSLSTPWVFWQLGAQSCLWRRWPDVLIWEQRRVSISCRGHLLLLFTLLSANSAEPCISQAQGGNREHPEEGLTKGCCTDM